jgi:hypothetical protein
MELDKVLFPYGDLAAARSWRAALSLNCQAGPSLVDRRSWFANGVDFSELSMSAPSLPTAPRWEPHDVAARPNPSVPENEGAKMSDGADAI